MTFITSIPSSKNNLWINKTNTMKKREPVSSIMTVELVTVHNGKHNLRDVKDIFRKKNIRHVPVMEGDKLIGIISKNDIMRLSFGSMFDNQGEGDEAILDMLTIDQVMSSHPVSVSSDTPIKDVAETFVKEHFHSLPVSDDGKLVGIVTSTDVIRYLLEQY